MGDTKIQWTNKTWNPIRARNIATDERGWYCEKVTEGCRNCYAEKMNVNTYFGNGAEYKPASLPQLELFLDEKILQQPLHWRKPQNIFPCSMTDLFGRWVSDEWLDRIFAVMHLAEQHTFQITTKRPERALEYLTQQNGRKVAIENSAIWTHNASWPLPNIWPGASAEDQKTYDERRQHLEKIPARIMWWSLEPLLSSIDLRLSEVARKPDWVVVGGESGPNARSLDVAWIASVVDQCKAASVPIFVKQLGYRPWWDGISTKAPASHVYLENKVMFGKVGWQFDCMDRKGGKIEEWPDDLQVREFPKAVAA